ncbi:MAG: hypothetical protein ACKPAE_14420, partial [Microcystis panniformis]
VDSVNFSFQKAGDSYQLSVISYQLSVVRRLWFFGLSYAMDGSIRDETLIEKDIWRFLSIVCDLERTNQLNLLPDQDLVDLCLHIESYQVTKNL